MRKISFTLGVGIFPKLDDMVLYPSECFLFRNTGVGYPVQSLLQQFPFLLRSEVAVVGNTLVVAVGHKVHDVLLQVGSCTGNDINLALPDHFCQGNTQFCSAHRTRQGYHHFTSFEQVLFVAFGSINKGSCIEMTVVVLNER